MSFDGVPWVVSNGEVTAAVGRAFANAATRNAQGVAQRTDLKVTQTTVASQSVQIATGSCIIRNAQATGESYVGLARSSTTKSISVTGSARTDMVIARVKDPDFSPWQPSDVPDQVNGPYVEPYVVQGVPSNATTLADAGITYSGIPLARIAVPSSGNITTAMITDLRSMALPRTELQQYTTIPASEQVLSSSSYVNWPSQANQTVLIPTWACKVVIEVLMGGIKTNSANPVGNTWGGIRARLGSSSGTSVLTRETGYDKNTPLANNYDRITAVVADTLTIPSSLIGTSQPFTIEGYLNAGANATISADTGGTVVSSKLYFIEAPN